MKTKSLFTFLFSAETPIEVTFSGGEYITYDLRQKGFEPILSTNDEISLHFKTRKSNGLLFYTGENITSSQTAQKVAKEKPHTYVENSFSLFQATVTTT